MSWFKFLGHDAVAPFSGRPWPQPAAGRPGEWMVWSGPRDPCRSGLHVCRIADLPLWLNEELFAVEVDGEVDEYSTFAVTSRARLSTRIERWGIETARRFSDDCAGLTRRLAEQQDGPGAVLLADYAADAATFAGRVRAGESWAAATATTAFVAATAARVAAGTDGPAAETAERARQARWLEQQVVHTG